MGSLFEKKWEERWEQTPERGPANPLFTEEDLSEEFPESWNMDEFKNLNSFAARIRYVQSHFKPISSGSARKVFKMDETHALKLAYNKKGLAQNEVEVDAYDELTHIIGEDFLAPIDDYDKEDYQWVMMRLAKKATANDFKQHTGLSMGTFFAFIYDLINKHEHQRRKSGQMLSKEVTERIWDMYDDYPLLNGVIDLIGNYNNYYHFGDLTKKNSYGVVDGKLVLVDYGLSVDVYDTHYNKQRIRENKSMKIVITENQKEKLAFLTNGLKGETSDYEILNQKCQAIKNKLDATPVGELNEQELRQYERSVSNLDKLEYKLWEYLLTQIEPIGNTDEDKYNELESTIDDLHHSFSKKTLELDTDIGILLMLFGDKN